MKEKEVFNVVDFMKIYFMFGMVVRHFPLYMLPPEPEGEYSLLKVTLYSLFIPVTTSFIGIIGIGFAFSRTISWEKYRARFLKGIGLVALVFTADASWLVLRGGAPDFAFWETFLTYRWNTVGKPGFYILLSIAPFYLLSFVQLLHGGQRILLHVTVLLACLFLFDFYLFHYLLLGWVVFVLFFEFRALDALNALSRPWLHLLTIGCMVGYASCYSGLFLEANALIELLLFLLSIPPLFVATQYIKRSASPAFLSSGKAFASLVLPFYLGHVALLTVLGGLVKLDPHSDILLLEIVFFASFAYLILKIQRTWLFYVRKVKEP